MRLAALGRSCRNLIEGQAELAPNATERRYEPIDVRIGMERIGCEAEALGAAGNGRVIDRLHIDRVLVEQPVARGFRCPEESTVSRNACTD